MLKIEVKYFKELSSLELYNLLQLRSEVFVVEQDCVYQDLDGKDEIALHVLGFKNNKLVAYARIFDCSFYFDQTSIGRVVVAKNERQYKYGYDIMKASIEAIKNKFNQTTIKISAQVYLKKFYSNLGFKTVAQDNLEDDSPHIAMLKQ
mgnify:CR=1 FL=1